jgi:5-methylcytosine-specific restriction endonuclease McrA
MRNVLLLDVGFRPHQVITAFKALDLLEQGKTQEIVPGDTIIRTSTRTFRVPAVIKLTYSIKVPYRGTVPYSRRALFTRDNYECQFNNCKRKATTRDHVYPESLGGPSTWTNLVAACGECNNKKANKTLDQLGWTLKNKPYAPKAWFSVVFKFELDPAWIPYLPEMT